MDEVSGLISSQSEIIERRKLRLQVMKRKVELWTELNEKSEGSKEREMILKTEKLLRAQLQSLEIFMTARLMKIQEKRDLQDQVLKKQQDLEQLRGKLVKFGLFLEFESNQSISCRLLKQSSKQKYISDWNMQVPDGIEILDVWKLSNSFWRANHQITKNENLFMNLPRSLVQRTTVHGLAEIPLERLKETFSNILDSKGSHVLNVISDKQRISFPLTFWKSFGDSIRKATGGCHFILVVSSALNLERDQKSIAVNTSEGIYPLAFIVYNTKDQQEESLREEEQRILKSIQKKEKEFLAWINNQTTF